MTETFNCFICGKNGCTEKDYSGDGIYVCQECEKFSSAANLLLSVPSEEIEYLADFVEADTENDLYEISEAVMVRVNKVREWLKAVEQKRAADGAKSGRIVVSPDIQACMPKSRRR